MKDISFRKTRIIIIVCTILLVVIGCLMVYSASMFNAAQNMGNEYFYLQKQVFGGVLGLIAMIAISFVPFEKLKKFKWIGIIVSFILLLLVFVPGIGKENYGARRWIGFGGFSFQPSEIAKFALVLFLACHFSREKNTTSFKNLLLPLLIGGIMCVLIILEPNMSITMCVGLVLLTMIFLGGTKKKHLFSLGVPALAAVPLLIIAEPYRIKRLVAFLDPWATPKGEGFQLIQSLYALGSGSFLGVGLFSSRQKNMFLPFAESDFIFSILVEELGFLGGITLIGIFIALIFAIVKVALNSKNKFGFLLAAGIASVIFFQVAINICVVTGMIPPTGLPLPFISAGSTSLVVFMAAMGVCLNISKNSAKNTFEKK